MGLLEAQQGGGSGPSRGGFKGDQYFWKLCFEEPKGRKGTQCKESQRREELAYRH